MSLMSNYPQGFANGISIRGMPINQTHPGNVFWVSNATSLLTGQIGGSDNNAGTFNQPFGTIDYAIGRCTAGAGDIIMVKPGHAENITAAGTIAADVAGVAIIGLGSGAGVPTLTWTTVATASITVSAANVSFCNMKFVANVADITNMFNVSGTADGLSFENCFWTDTDSTHNWLDCVVMATGCDNVSFNNCRWNGLSASNDSMIKGVAHDGFYMDGCQLNQNIAQTSVVGLVLSSGNVTNAWIKNSVFRSNIDGALLIDFNGAACGGHITNCYMSSIDAAGATTAGIDFTGGHAFECYVAGEADTYGIIGGGAAYNDA